MVWLEAADLIHDAVEMPSLKLSETSDDESGVRDSIKVGQIQGIHRGIQDHLPNPASLL